MCYNYKKPVEVSVIKNQYTAIIKKEDEWWIGWIEEIPGVNCQEASRDELMMSLKTTLAEAIEFNRQDSLSHAGNSFEEEKIAL
jgi:predicted RNase H-like HicB family nuclease